MANNNGNFDAKTAGVNKDIGTKIAEALQLLELVDCDEAKTKLKQARDLLYGLNSYAVSKSTPLSSLLKNVIEETMALDFVKLRSEEKLKFHIKDTWKMGMISSTGQVQLLQFLIRRLKCRSILEIGTYMGYGALGMAEVMAPGGKVTGIDIEPYFCDFVNKTARERNLNVEIKEGAAIEVLESLAKEGEKYDFVYIDCVKQEYSDYFKIIMNNGMLLSDGIIACDNVLWDCRSIDRGDHAGICLDEFNSMVTQDSRVTSVLLPCFDGLLLIQHNI